MGLVYAAGDQNLKSLVERVKMSRTVKKLVPYMFFDQAKAQEMEEYAHSRWIWGFSSQIVWTRLHSRLLLLVALYKYLFER